MSNLGVLPLNGPVEVIRLDVLGSFGYGGGLI